MVKFKRSKTRAKGLSESLETGYRRINWVVVVLVLSLSVVIVAAVLFIKMRG